MIEIFRATHADIDEIQNLLYPHYFNESTYSDLDYDPDVTRKSIVEWIDGGIVALARVKGVLAGFAVMSLMRSFYRQIEADVDMFYVLPEFRGTGVSRWLVDTLVKTAEANDAKVIYTACLSGIDEKNNTLYVNLWKKYGFKTLGTVLIRS